eukprot:7386353-Prymnesium_polylepis.2
MLVNSRTVQPLHNRDARVGSVEGRSLKTADRLRTFCHLCHSDPFIEIPEGRGGAWNARGVRHGTRARASGRAAGRSDSEFGDMRAREAII